MVILGINALQLHFITLLMVAFPQPSSTHLSRGGNGAEHQQMLL